MIRHLLIALMAAAMLVSSCNAATDLDRIAETYVRLVLALGEHDPDFVDAFYGPAEWKAEATKEKRPLDRVIADATSVLDQLSHMPDTKDEPIELRRRYLTKQTSALVTRARMLGGNKPGFDDECKALYDAQAPHFDKSRFDAILSRLSDRMPGTGPLSQRYEAWRKPFTIPKEKLDKVFQLAIVECRKRTLAHASLPPGESFTVEYVTDKPWGGYNWYKGGYRSLIQVNTDLPVFIDRAVDLAAHEGYPGHHVYNVLLEKNLVRDRGWIEFTVYPLFSPQSLIAEGTANFGREVVFSKAERLAFEKEVLFPAAGIDAARADEYYAVQDLMKELSFAGNEVARRLLNGEIDDATAQAELEKYSVYDPARAKQRLKFIAKYRSYVINYNVGEQLVADYISRRGGDESDPVKRWKLFTELLSSPRLPGDLR